jgi:hypothetical protein
MIIASEIPLFRRLFYCVVLIAGFFLSFIFFIIFIIIRANGTKNFSFDGLPLILFLTYLALIIPVFLAIFKTTITFYDEFITIGHLFGLFTYIHYYHQIKSKESIVNNNKCLILKLKNGEYLIFYEKTYDNYSEFSKIVKSKASSDDSLKFKNHFPKALKIFFGIGVIILLLHIISLKIYGYW